MVHQPPVEVIGDERGEPIADRLWLWFRDHRWALALLVACIVLVAGFVVVRAVRGPAVPPLLVEDGNSSLTVAPWQGGAGGRPLGPVLLSFSATVRQQEASDAQVNAVGISGPGVTGVDNPATPLAAGRAVDVPLRVELDCRKVPVTLPPQAYGLQVRAVAGSRSSTTVVPAGAAGRSWQTAIVQACSSWTARHDLTVSALTARVDPVLPRVDVQLTVTNSGPRQGQLFASTQYGPPIRVLGGLPLRVPAHRSATTALSLVLDRCDSIDDPRDLTVPLTRDSLLTSQINLYALAGPGDASLPGDTAFGGDGLGPTAVVLAAGPAQTLVSALSQACGGIGPILPLVSPGTIRFNPRTRELRVPLIIDVTPGRVQRVSLKTESATELVSNGVASGDVYRPLWTSFPDLVPDRTGQVRVTLSYRVPPSGVCPDRGGLAPGFIATLRVPVAGVVRQLAYSGSIDLTEDPASIYLLCRSR